MGFEVILRVRNPQLPKAVPIKGPRNKSVVSLDAAIATAELRLVPKFFFLP